MEADTQLILRFYLSSGNRHKNGNFHLSWAPLTLEKTKAIYWAQLLRSLARSPPADWLPSSGGMPVGYFFVDEEAHLSLECLVESQKFGQGRGLLLKNMTIFVE